MSLSISQMLAASYPAVVAEKRRPANQWSESAFMAELERQGAIKTEAFGLTIECPLDYRRNAGAQILPTDLSPTSLTKTEVITAASFTPANVSVPVVWSKADESQNPSENQKVAFVDSLIENALASHDDLIEQTLLGTTSNGLIGLLSMITDDGTGTIGGIDAGVEVWNKNKFGDYTGASDIEAVFTSVWNKCTKGSGSQLTPKILVSDAATQATFEGTQQALQRYIDTDTMTAGFKVLAFKTARYVFSQYGTARVFFLNPKSYQLRAAKGYFRMKGKEQELENGEGYKTSIYSAVQAVTNNRSRLGVAF